MVLLAQAARVIGAPTLSPISPGAGESTLDPEPLPPLPDTPATPGRDPRPEARSLPPIPGGIGRPSMNALATRSERSSCAVMECLRRRCRNDGRLRCSCQPDTTRTLAAWTFDQRYVRPKSDRLTWYSCVWALSMSCHCAFRASAWPYD
jgi:hypothetical protein